RSERVFYFALFYSLYDAASEYHSVYTADRGGCQQRGDVHHSRRFSRSSENHYYGDIPQIFGNPAGVCHYRPLVRGKGHYLSYLRAEHGVPCKRNQKLFCEPSPLHAVYAFFHRSVSGDSGPDGFWPEHSAGADRIFSCGGRVYRNASESAHRDHYGGADVYLCADVPL